jgi:hypothetical protein
LNPDVLLCGSSQKKALQMGIVRVIVNELETVSPP